MRAAIRFSIVAVLVLAAAVSTADAQRVADSKSYREYTPVFYWTHVNWKPDYEVAKRYAFAIHPFHQVNAGFRLDFEMELPRAGRWLQFSGMYYHRKQFKQENYDSDWSYREGWYTFSGDIFTKLDGWGMGMGYKQFFGPSGWYWLARVNYNHYKVGYDREAFFPYVEDGLKFYVQEKRQVFDTFDNLSTDINIGYSLDVCRNVFFDCFMGFGYSHSFHRDEFTPFDDFLSFGYRGWTYSFGMRVGFLWESKRKWND
ncbi:hypothetical protein LJC45_06095 [Alistipes sp. OttesenSCG-928-B03]|nr:hypothetical protein [Alistipes sp. OttesenSCG-928-B03]